MNPNAVVEFDAWVRLFKIKNDKKKENKPVERFDTKIARITTIAKGMTVILVCKIRVSANLGKNNDFTVVLPT